MAETNTPIPTTTADPDSSAKWIQFHLAEGPVGGKTQVWVVMSQAGLVCLGSIRWSTGWRKYTFYPANACVFEEDCLRAIADFIELKTRKHKETWKDTHKKSA